MTATAACRACAAGDCQRCLNVYDETVRCDCNHTPRTTESPDYGVRFYDGSVMHPWNGRTQAQRAQERLAELRANYPRDGFTLVTRDGKNRPWREADE